MMLGRKLRATSWYIRKVDVKRRLREREGQKEKWREIRSDVSFLNFKTHPPVTHFFLQDQTTSPPKSHIS